jgi:hypothetical protein
MIDYKTILIFILAFCTAEAQSISFKKEIIEVKVAQDYCTLNGDYFFENNGFNSSETQIYYPFVINNSLPFPDSISIYNNSTLQFLPYLKLKEGISFRIKVEPHSIIQLKVIYKQNILKNYFEYILTSTADWNKPLESAEFNILFSPSCLNPNISYKEDSIKASKEFIQYAFTKLNFMPEKNLVIKWETEK